jgi:hypothetical protein
MPYILPTLLDDICATLAATNPLYLFLCSGSSEPTDFAEATAAKLAQHTVTGDITVADDVDGKKATLSEQTGITVSSNGTATYYALCNADTLLFAAPLAASGGCAITTSDTPTFFALKIINQRTPTSA